MALKFTLLVVLGLYILLRVVLRERTKAWVRWLDRAGIVFGLLAAMSLTSFGSFVRGRFINTHDVYHYYFGAKYSPELQYAGLYDCTFAALEEVLPKRVKGVRSVRSMDTYDRVPKRKMGKAKRACKERFSVSRWAEFKADLRAFDRAFRFHWKSALGDKGYNATPLWDSVGGHIASLVPSGRAMYALACLDIGLLALCLVFVFEAFGPKGLVICLLALGGGYELAHSHIRSGFLRLDWLAAMFAAVALFRLKRPVWAGGFLAYAAAIRVFPVLFVAGPALSVGLHYVRHRVLRVPERNFVLGFGAVSVALLGFTLVEPGGVRRFESFVHKISVHRLDVSTTRVGLDYALVYEGETHSRDFESRDGKKGFRPHFVKRKQDRKATFSPLKYGLTLSFLCLLAWYLSRRSDEDPDEMLLESFLLGFPLVYLLLNPTFYYYVYLAPFLLGFSLLRGRRLLSVSTPFLFIALGLSSFAVEKYIRFDYLRHFVISTLIGAVVLGFSALLVVRGRRFPPREVVTQEPDDAREEAEAEEVDAASPTDEQTQSRGPSSRRRAPVVAAATLLGCVGLGALAYGLLRDGGNRVVPDKVFSGEEETVTLLFGGDTSFARGVDTVVSRHGGDVDFPLARIAERLKAADFVLLNLENVLSSNLAESAEKRWLLHADPRFGKALENASVDMVSVANNHALDLGQAGFKDTLATLDAVNVLATGVEHAKGVQDPPVVQIGHSTFAFIGYNRVHFGASNDFFPRPHFYDKKEVLRAIKRAKANVDHVVVTVHRGHEYRMVPTDAAKAEARAMVDAGAELVINHHPHVPQQVERYKEGVIAYSLGNFLFDMYVRFKVLRTRRGFMLEAVYTKGKLVDVRLVPTNSSREHQPYVDEALDTESFFVKPEAGLRLSERLEHASVTRDGEACAEWSTKPPKRKYQYMEWFRGRHVCAADAQSPFLTVAITGERSESVFERGIWAQPQPGTPLELRFPSVPLGEKLRVVGGMPDYAQKLASKLTAQPVRFEVTAGDASTAQTLPFEAGWRTFEVPTPAGGSEDVVVQLEGGSLEESGYMFEVFVE